MLTMAKPASDSPPARDDDDRVGPPRHNLSNRPPSRWAAPSELPHHWQDAARAQLSGVGMVFGL
jgi:hypothetical protein